ncbi:MAG: GNAT family N-acetyltransferase [Marmoricola sp.]
MLESGSVRLRPLARSDRRAWHEVRRRNQAWLRRWDATSPPGSPGRPRTFGAMVRSMQRGARAGSQLPFALEVDGVFAGQVTVNNIVRGSAQFASVGYWIDQRYAGRGVMPRGVALVIDHCLGPVGLHRVEISIRPENTASLRVMEKLGIEEYGFAPSFLHIDGQWRDHRLFAITREQAGRGVLHRLDSSHQSQ